MALTLLRAVFTVLGAVALVAGLVSVLGGPDAQIDGMGANPSVESEFRFYAWYWSAFGVACLWVARRVEREPTVVRGLALFLFAGGLTRIVSWVAEGRPHAVYLVLMALELTIPIMIVAAQRRLPV